MGLSPDTKLIHRLQVCSLKSKILEQKGNFPHQKDVENLPFFVMDDMINTYNVDVDHKCYMPEKGLLAAILERSFRDLFSCNYLDFKNAMSWFNSKYMERIDYRFRYIDVAEDLELSAAQTILIRQQVKKFTKYVDDFALFKQDRLGVSTIEILTIQGPIYQSEASYARRVHR